MGRAYSIKLWLPVLQDSVAGDRGSRVAAAAPVAQFGPGGGVGESRRVHLGAVGTRAPGTVGRPRAVRDIGDYLARGRSSWLYRYN